MAAFQQATEASEGDKMKQLSEETQRLLEEAGAFLENTEMQTQTEEDSFAEASPSVTVRTLPDAMHGIKVLPSGVRRRKAWTTIASGNGI